MKEELLRALNNKLNDLNSDIDSLVEINKKIDKESANLSYISSIISLFKDNDENNILNFSKINKEDFDKVIGIIGENAKETFSTDSCNYDGLVYLINGINNGITIELNDEQKNAINYLIDELNNKVDEYSSAIDGYELVKTRYEISDVEELTGKRDNYNKTISSLTNDDYITDTSLLMEALKYSDLPEGNIIDILGYVLGYNANVYKEKGPITEEAKEEKEEIHEEENHGIVFEDNNEETMNNMFTLEENENYSSEPSGTHDENTYHEDIEEPINNEADSELSSIEDEFHFNAIPETNIQEFSPITFDSDVASEKEEPSEEVNYELPQYDYEPKDITPSDMENTGLYNVVEDNNIVEENNVIENDNVVEENNVIEDNSVEETPLVETENIETEVKENTFVDNDFKDVIDDKVDYDEKDEFETKEMSSTRDLQKLFDKYGIKEDKVYINELVTGDPNRYQELLEVLSKKGLLDKLKGQVLVEVLLGANSDDIIKVLDIIEEDLSVDKDDYDITVKIALDTIPSAFITNNGNYRNFVENTRLFKELGLNLINLFDFSKELFIASHDRILKNLEVVKAYGFNIDYRNAKYMLLLPNIGERLDYYVESVYEDKLKNTTFDGAIYIKDFAAKLNVVTDETIKRIRYSSENGRKVFGSKPGSLTGEITNLRVNALDISSEYLNKFFNNDFAILTGDEVREYVRLINESSNVGDYSDELEILNPYLNGLRYVIEGINISSNKVVRNYSILRSYDVDKRKALEFAVCYNLVITKEEYDRLDDKLNEIGGNL